MDNYEDRTHYCKRTHCLRTMAVPLWVPSLSCDRTESEWPLCALYLIQCSGGGSVATYSVSLKGWHGWSGFIFVIKIDLIPWAASELLRRMTTTGLTSGDELYDLNTEVWFILLLTWKYVEKKMLMVVETICTVVCEYPELQALIDVVCICVSAYRVWERYVIVCVCVCWNSGKRYLE